MSTIIFAIKDTHSESDGREKALQILQSTNLEEKIHVFFIEWSRPIDKEKIDQSFAGLNKTDSQPNLITLTKEALNRDIEVIPCDLTVEETINQLNALEDGYGPYNDKSVFQPWGKAIRDQHAALVIQNYCLTHDLSSSKGLVMFGADHFEAEAERKLKGNTIAPLHKLISCTEIDCYLLNENN